MNKVILIGRLTKDPELKKMPNGDYVLGNAIAVNRDYTNQQGEREADFINFVAFRKTAEVISRYIVKGDKILLEGRWQKRSYVNNNNQTVYVDELIVDKLEFLQSKPKTNEDPYANYDFNNNQKQPGPFEEVQNQYSITDDDCHFNL